MDFGVSRCVLLTALIIFIQGEQTQLGALEQSTEIDIQGVQDQSTEMNLQGVIPSLYSLYRDGCKL